MPSSRVYPNPMTADLIGLFQRDLEKLCAELEQYPDEATLWTVVGDIKNSAGNLALHVVGNLNHFIGVKLGNSGYLRNREAEFARKDIPRTKILEQLKNTKTMIGRVLLSLDDAALEAPYPEEPLGYKVTTGYFLLHLYGHLNWHLGQVNYHRRLTAL